MLVRTVSYWAGICRVKDSSVCLAGTKERCRLWERRVTDKQVSRYRNVFSQDVLYFKDNTRDMGLDISVACLQHAPKRVGKVAC